METGSSESPFPKTLILGIYLHGEIPLTPGIEGQREEEESRARAELRKQRTIESIRTISRRLTQRVHFNPSLGSEARQARFDARSVQNDPVTTEPPADLIPEELPLILNQFISLNAVTCGISNVSNTELFNQVGSIVKDFSESSSSFLKNTHSLEQWKQYINTLRQILVYKNKEVLKDIKKKLGETDMSTLSRSEQEYIKSMEEYVHLEDRAYGLHVFKKGDLIINKKFIKLDPREMRDNTGPYVNKIIAYHVDGAIDVFELIESVKGPLKSITLFNIFDFLYGLGVKTLVLIDLSCNVFVHNGREIRNPRVIRAHRRSVTRGGKRKTLKKKHFYKYKLYGNH
jgi:hypothetical protein